MGYQKMLNRISIILFPNDQKATMVIVSHDISIVKICERCMNHAMNYIIKDSLCKLLLTSKLLLLKYFSSRKFRLQKYHHTLDLEYH